MTPPTIFTILGIAITGGALRRWRGMNKDGITPNLLPRWLCTGLLAAPYGLLCFKAHYDGTWPLPGNAPGALDIVTLMLACLTIYAVSFMFIATGTGSGQDMGHAEVDRKNEKTEALTSWLRPYMTEWQYDFMFMAVNGFLITLAPGIALGSPAIAISGMLQAPAYALGWWLWDTARWYSLTVSKNRYYYPNNPHPYKWGGLYHGIAFLPRNFDQPTEIGEFLTWFFLWGVLAWRVFI